MNSNYKNIVWAVLVLVVIIGGYYMFKGTNDSAGDKMMSDVSVPAGEISVNGVIACLPYKAATAGQGCVKSVKGDDGKVYALNSLKVNNAEMEMDEGTKVTAVGAFQPADASNSDSSVFSYDGVLVLSSLLKR